MAFIFKTKLLAIRFFSCPFLNVSRAATINTVADAIFHGFFFFAVRREISRERGKRVVRFFVNDFTEEEKRRLEKGLKLSEIKWKGEGVRTGSLLGR